MSSSEIVGARVIAIAGGQEQQQQMTPEQWKQRTPEQQNTYRQ